MTNEPSPDSSPFGAIPSPPAAPLPPVAACWACRRRVDRGDLYCRWCGKKQQVSDNWYFRPLWIVVMTLTVLGPFTLPLVWRSPSLTKAQRWALSLFIVGITAFVFYLGYILFAMILERFSEISKASHDM